jgi:hypothetical protein
VADWAKIDVSFFRHPQVVQLSEREAVAFLRMILYCQEHETDGHVPDPALRACEVTPKQAKSMEGVALLHRNGSGWMIDGFTRKQRTRAELERERDQNRKRAETARRRKAERQDADNE